MPKRRKEMYRNFVGNALRATPRLILGGVFVYASLSKLAFPESFANVVAQYGILPRKIVWFFALALPWAELMCGALLLAGLFIRESATIASLLLVIFMVAIAMKAMNGSMEGCGCFAADPSGEPHSVLFVIVRDIFLLFCGVLSVILNSMNRVPFCKLRSGNR